MTSPRETAIYIHCDVIRGHHIYKVVWTPTIEERLCVQREPRNAHDRRAVAVLTSEDTLVGHAPREISKKQCSLERDTGEHSLGCHE